MMSLQCRITFGIVLLLVGLGVLQGCEESEAPIAMTSSVSIEYASSCAEVNHGNGPVLWRCENKETICYIHSQSIACGFKDKPQPEARGY